jgi:beta-lactamase class A
VTALRVFVFLFVLTLGMGTYLVYKQYTALQTFKSELLAARNTQSPDTAEATQVLGKEAPSVSITSASPSSKTHQVADIISEHTSRVNGTTSVYYRNLTSDETVLVNGEEQYYMASLYKLIVTLFVLQYEKEGKLHFTDQIGSPPLTIEEALTRIITESNNEYAQAIAKKYNWYVIQDTMTARLDIPFKFDSSLETNVISIGSLLTDVAQSIKVNDTESGYLLSLMNKQQRTGKLPKYLPKSIYTHNKTGEFEQYSHDGAIFYTPKANYVLVFMSKTGSPGTTDEQMARMSEEIYKTLNEK